MAVVDTPCEPWPVDTTCLPADWVEPYTEAQQAAIDVASEILWRLSGRKYGQCELTLRPCRRSCVARVVQQSGVQPYVVGGEWFNAGCECGTECSCVPLCELELPGPILSVTEVLVDGVVVDPATYRVDNYEFLVREGSECWPECQDLTLPPTEPGTWAVTYVQGRPVPPAAQRAVAIYALEWFKACTDQPCRLPSRATQIARQGVSLQLASPEVFVQDGLTGVPEVDVWLGSVRWGAGRPGRVFSPDISSPRMTTWP